MANVTSHRLAQRRATEDGQVRFASDRPQDGRNDFGDLEVTLSADQQVVDVRVHRTDGLRTNEQLRAALSEAIAAAELARLGDSLRTAGKLELYARSEAVAATIRIPRVPPRRRHGPPSRAALESLAARPVPRFHPVTGVSSNGYLRLSLLGAGPGVEVDADEAWLSAAPPPRLSAALREAFHDLSENLR